MISSDSIFVTESGEWKLGGLYLATEKQNLDYSVLKNHQTLIPFVPPELLKGSWKDSKTFDSFGFGSFLKTLNEDYNNCLKVSLSLIVFSLFFVVLHR